MTQIDYRKHTQTVWDVWEDRERVLVFRGECACCGARVFDFLDGKPDPHQMLNERHRKMRLQGNDHGLHPASFVIACASCYRDDFGKQTLLNALHRNSDLAHRREQQTCENLP